MIWMAISKKKHNVVFVGNIKNMIMIVTFSSINTQKDAKGGGG